jgi:hypothetical protein
VAEQLRSVLDDFGTDAAKCGIASTRPSCEAVADTLFPAPAGEAVVDPVRCQVGRSLLQADRRAALADRILPCPGGDAEPTAEGVLPNAGDEPEDMEEAAGRSHLMGLASVWSREAT